MARIVIFGAGVAGKRALERLSDRDEVVCFADNDPKKHHSEFCSHPIRPPEDLRGLDYDYILIGSMYHQEIKRQLIGMDIPEGRILVDPELLVGGSQTVSWGCFLLFIGASLVVVFAIAGGVLWWWVGR